MKFLGHCLAQSLQHTSTSVKINVQTIEMYIISGCSYENLATLSSKINIAMIPTVMSSWTLKIA